jgi:uncharacterized SAM-binding protein YcdF (DUF218 family)
MVMKWFKWSVKLILVILVVLVALDALLVFGMAHWRPPIPKTDAVIVLGAAIYTPALYNRTLEGLHLYEQGKAKQMVLSGGKIASSDISEAEYMEQVVRANADPAPNYILEDQSHSTYENIRNAKQKLDQKSSVIIVSDQFHLARAVLLAKREGFDQVYWSAPQPSYYRAEELRFYYIRELVAMFSYIPKFIWG